MQVWMKRLPILIEALLVLLLAWFMIGWILSDNGTGMSPSEMLSVKDGRGTLDAKLILNVPLFGVPEKIKPATPKKNHKKVSSSQLKIQLLGTVVAGEKSAAVVMMQGSKEQKVLFLGDSIQSGVVLKEVMAEAIIFKRNGRLERITLRKGTNKSVVSPLPAAKPPHSSNIQNNYKHRSRR